ncbi:WD40-repeat-containing domain protein [Lipomyces orientalis]|uniref:WD40-repeat-containing domain protein n=1 Tax=Lipomyces orientalis TaxID=1233043 RepID=A0ACC3TY77_9ASCO
MAPVLPPRDMVAPSTQLPPAPLVDLALSKPAMLDSSPDGIGRDTPAPATSSEHASETAKMMSQSSSTSATSSQSKLPHRRASSPSSSSSTAVIDSWTQFLDAILEELHCPIAKYGIPSNDFSVLSCGCVASEQWARSRLPNLQLKVCPNCGNSTELKRPVVPLRNIYNIVMDKRKELGLPVPEEVGSDEEAEEEVDICRPEARLPKIHSSGRRNSPRMPSISRLRIDPASSDFLDNTGSGDSDSLRRIPSTVSGQSSTNELIEGRHSGSDRRPSSTIGGGPPSPKMNLVSLFSSVARQTLNAPSSDGSHHGSRSRTDDHESSLASSSFTPPSSLHSQPSTSLPQHKSSGFQAAIEPWSVNANADFAPIMLSPEDEAREKHFAENYPIYRKDVRYATQSNKGFSVIPRGKVFEATAISPDTRRLALVADKRWEVFTIPTSYKVGSSPTLVCVGKSSGEYGPSLDACTRRDPNDKVRSMSWSQTMAAMSNRFLAIAGTHGVLRVHDLDKLGAPIYTEISPYPIRCIALSPDGVLLACAVTSKDPVSNTELPVIILHDLSHLMGLSSTPIKSIQIDMPYRDPINTLSFSNDGKLLSCSTILESRFMVINLYDLSNPRLVIRSSRRLDTSFESEGITCMRFFPGNRLMVIASVANNAYPIIVDTKIPSHTSPLTVAMPISATTTEPTALSNRAYSVSSLNSAGNGGFQGFPQDDDDEYDVNSAVISSSANSMFSSRMFVQPAPPVTSGGGASTSGSGGLLQPKMVTRFHEVGTAIHQVAVSPRANSAAFLSRNGTVFLTHFLRVEAEHRRVVAVVDVTNANKISEAASIAFSPNGQKLIIVDRKGILYIEDFGVGTENGEILKKCRIIK